MSEPFLAEIKIIGFNFAPRGWALCDGQILPINQNQSLYSLLGTTYGGDGRTEFALPDLRGRSPMHVGTAIGGGASGGPATPYGQNGGANDVTLDPSQVPAHSHAVRASAEPAAESGPGGQMLAKQARFAPDLYAPADDTVDLDGNSVGNAGGGQPHPNQQPWLGVYFVIALVGLFPSRN